MAGKTASASTGGDGTGAAEAAAADTSVDTSKLPALQDASANEAELEAHISEVLGLPTEKVEDKGDGISKSEAGEETGKTGGQSDSGSGAAGGSGDSKDDLPKVVEQPATKVAEPVKAEATPVVAAPLELKVTDADGTEFTLKPGDDIDAVLKDFKPTGTGQIMNVIGKFQALNAQADEAKVQEQTKEQQAQAEAEFKSIQASWDNEITALQASERIGKPAVALTDPAYKDDPVAKRVDAVFQFMTTENKARQEAARTAGTAYLPIRSFTDALDKLELQEMRTNQTKVKNQELENAKAKSAAIGGGAGSGGGSVEKPYVPGSAKSIWDV